MYRKPERERESLCEDEDEVNATCSLKCRCLASKLTTTRARANLRWAICSSLISLNIIFNYLTHSLQSSYGCVKVIMNIPRNIANLKGSFQPHHLFALKKHILENKLESKSQFTQNTQEKTDLGHASG